MTVRQARQPFQDGGGIKAEIRPAKGDAATIEVERVISVVGVVGNVAVFGLEALGVAMTRA